VLENREIRRVGDNRVRKIDVRIVCATNRKLDQEVNAGRFREDLYYRLSVVQIELPPLRRRKEDLPLLARHFLCDLHGADAMSQVARFDETMDVLKRHDWPGNVRELRNLIEVAFYAPGRPVDLSAFLGLGRFLPHLAEEAESTDVTADRPFKDAKNDLIADFERKYLEDLLQRNDGNISQSAREAGIERAYLQRLIRKYELK
jgi:DNA-binding NtrC family response regulator